MAKRLDGPYTPDKRTMIKVKHERTADCAVAGYRVHKDGAGVGSLLLGLYDDEGTLHHVGVAAGFTVKQRRELLAELEPMTEGAIEGHPWQHWAEAMREEAGRMPGAQSRWNAGKDLSWVPIRVERVAEVTFGQLQSGRFRHGVRLVRWRPDRTPDSCTYDQLDVADPVRFDELFRRVERHSRSGSAFGVANAYAQRSLRTQGVLDLELAPVHDQGVDHEDAEQDRRSSTRSGSPEPS